jgi:hypothetical protein
MKCEFRVMKYFNVKKESLPYCLAAKVVSIPFAGIHRIFGLSIGLPVSEKLSIIREV